MLLALAVLGPLLLGRGYWLVGDMVFVPQQPWKEAWLGLGTGPPRAVPMDAIISVLTQVVPGDLLQHGVLLLAFVLGGVGAGRLVAGHPAYARFAALSLFVWNPWVHDRLMMGQWAILAGYFTLPWVVVAAALLRREPGARRWLAALVPVLVAAVCSPSTGLMAAGVLVAVAARAGVRRVVPLGLLVLLPNLVWLVPTLVADTGTLTGDQVFSVFGARGESAAGVVASLLSLGGTWKSSIVAPERTTALIVLASVVLTMVAVAGVRSSRNHEADPMTVNRLVGVAVVSVLMALTPVLPGTRAAWETLGQAVPSLAFFRDGERFVAPAVLLLLPGIAGAATWVRSQVAPGRGALWLVVGLVVLAPQLLLPSLAWGDRGGLDRVEYPEEWFQVAELLASRDDTVAVLPWRGSYRGFDWNPAHAVLDPAPRFFPGEVLVDDRVYVDGEVVPGEDPRSGLIDEALLLQDPAPVLRSLGVDLVLVEKGMPGADEVPGQRLFAGRELVLIKLS